MENVISQLPCVIFDEINKEYAPKGWMYWKRNVPWTKELLSSKVYQNSAGAKNAMRGFINRFYQGPERKLVVLGFMDQVNMILQRNINQVHILLQDDELIERN